MKETNLECLIAALKELQSKGIKTVQFEGTLMSKEDGNTIVLTTENQI